MEYTIGAALVPLTVALFLATVNERLVEWIVEPLFDKFMVDSLWLMYVALITGGLIGGFSGVNLFQGFGLEGILWRILTAIIIGGGSNLVHMLFSSVDRANRT